MTAVGDVDDGPALVVPVADAAVDPGLFRRSADLTVTSYYATDWNATTFDGYEETGAVDLAEPGRAVVGGEYRIRDESCGLTGNYRGQLVGQVVDAVAESFRGAVPR